MYTNYEYTRTNEIAAVETFPETSQNGFLKRLKKDSKGVLCLFHGICYEDEDFVSESAALTDKGSRELQRCADASLQFVQRTINGFSIFSMNARFSLSNASVRASISSRK